MRATIAAAILATATLAGTVGAQEAARIEISPAAGYLLPGDAARGPYGTALRAGNAPVFGATAAFGLAGPVSLFGGAAYADSDLELGLPLVGGVAITDTRVLMLDAGIQVRGSGTKAPLVQLGLGSMHYRVATGLVDVKADNFMVSAGAGVDMALKPGLSLRLMVKDYVGKFDTRDAVFVDAPVRTAHNIAVTAGLRVAF